MLVSKKIDDRLFNIGQTGIGMRFLKTEVGRKTPKGLFAFKPDTVDHLVEKAALAFNAFTEYEVPEPGAAREIVALKMRAIPVALVFEKNRSRE